MAKSSGLGWTTFSVADSSGMARDLKNDLTDVSWTTPRAVQDVTGLDKFAKEALLLLADFTGTLSGVFNPAANLGHAVFKDCASTTVVRAMSLVVAAQTLAVNTYITDYQPNRAAGGAFTYKAPLVLADGTAPTWT